MIGCHCHTDRGSNIRILDSTNRVEDLIKTAHEMGYKGIAVTEHEALCSHVKAIQSVRKMKEKGNLPQDFKLILGNEIYLVNSMEEVKDNYKGGVTKFPHFLLLSTSKQGHEILRILSSRAWEKSFYTGTMERTPTLKADLEELIKANKGMIIGSSACLGSESSIHLLNIKEAEETGDEEQAQYHKEKLHEFITWCVDVFGSEYFFLEIQPALSEEQIYVNKKLVQMAEYYGLKLIVTTDAHFLRPEDRVIHRAFLNAKDAEREVDQFYEACFVQNVAEIKERMNYLDESIIEEAINNTLLIGDMVEDYTIEHDTIIPKIDLPEFELQHLFKPAYEQYAYIKEMAYSEDEQDNYMIKLIEDGFLGNIPYSTLSKEKFHEILSRINVELGELWEISKAINQTMSSYYITVREIVNIIWNDECGGNSLVGSGRGSSSGFLINYLLGITQINPLEYEIEMPHWRHLHKSRPDVGALDIDLDTEGSKRPQIVQALKNHFGEHRVLQVCTFGTEGSKSALQSACRGLGIDSDIAQFLSGLIPFERGSNWTLSDCLFGNEEKDRKPVKEFIREIEKYSSLKETALKIENLVNKRSIHAGGVVLFNDSYYKSNAMMKAPNGLPVTQFDLNDCQSLGSIKFDLLTIEALDKIRATLDMLLKTKEIEWQGSLRTTFDKYLHPNNIDIHNPKLYEMLGNGEVIDLFQFSTEVGYQAAIKVKPQNLLETAAANSLMRLMSEGEEQPIDTFIKYKNNIQLWYDEMNSYGLNEDEVKTMEKYLWKLNGVADTQEVVMLMSMDENIAGFDVKLASKLRKAIAKRTPEVLEEVQKQFFENGLKLGNRKEILNYTWNVQMKRMFGYAFSVLHTIPYSIVALQELNLNYKFDPLYWTTACLTVNSGSSDDLDSDEESTNKSSNYGKVASAIGNIRQRGVKVALPDINKAGFGFTPDIENNQIIFGLKGMNGIGDDIVRSIIENRPYTSFTDFMTRMFDTGLIKKKQMIQLIKGGCFDSFGDRTDIMKQFIERIVEPKTKLTMSNLSMLIENDIIPNDMQLYVRLFNYKKYISKSVYKTVDKPKDKLLLLDDIAAQFFNEHFTDECVVDMVNGKLVISEKKFKKEYDQKMEVIKEWIGKDEALTKLNYKLFINEWKEQCAGTISKWEMDSLSMYYHEHELAHVDKEKYGIVNFFEQPEEPVKGRPYTWRGRQMYEYQTYRIVGTVLDKDKIKHTVTVLTPDGVITVKLHGSKFSFYNKQISRKVGDKKEVLEKSWFTRGQKVMLTGFRRGNNFALKTYKNSIYQHSICLIDHIDENGNLSLTTERVQES